MRPTLLLLLVLVCVLGLPAGAGAEDEAAPTPGEIARAVTRGADWLRREFEAGFEDRTWHDAVELVVLTLGHAGSNLQDPVYAAGIEALAAAEPRFTYRTSLLAMALGHANPRLYQGKLVHCAQWLVDTQLANGAWGYPGSADGPVHQPLPRTVPAPETTEAPQDEVRIERLVPVSTYRAEKGDFSNTQFAILGLRACRDAGIVVPRSTWKDALAYLRKTQRPDGGWGYVMGGEQDGASYASLTCAALCSVAICLHASGKRVTRSDATLRKGLRWLDTFFEPSRNTGVDRSSIIGPSTWQLYHLYALERAGQVLALQRVAERDWYAEGARWLIDRQAGDGSWEDPGAAEAGRRPRYLKVADTCFAILFLTRATPPLTPR